MGWKEWPSWLKILIVWFILSLLAIGYLILTSGSFYFHKLLAYLILSFSILIFLLSFSFIAKRIYLSKQLNYWLRGILVWFMGLGLITILIFILIGSCSLFFLEYNCRSIGYLIFLIIPLGLILLFGVMIYFIINRKKK